MLGRSPNFSLDEFKGVAKRQFGRLAFLAVLFKFLFITLKSFKIFL